MTPESLPEIETKAFRDALLAALERSGLAAEAAIGSASPEELVGVLDFTRPRAEAHQSRGA